MSRAMTAPLTIRLDYTGISRAGRIQPTIAVLTQYCDRWQKLDLCIPESMVSRLDSIRDRLPWLKTLRIQNPTESRSWSHELSIFEFAPQLCHLSLGCGISHTRLKIPWHQLIWLEAHVNDTDECLGTLQLVPNLIKCRVCRKSDVQFPKASIPSQNISILSFPHLRFFRVLHLPCLDKIFKHLELPNIHALHVAGENKQAKDAWFSRQPFISFLSHSSHTLRKLEIDCLRACEDSAHIVRCLRATPSLTELHMFARVRRLGHRRSPLSSYSPAKRRSVSPRFSGT